MKTALIIGAGGQDGQLLAALLRAQGCQVWGADPQAQPAEAGVAWVDLDLFQPEAVAAAFQRMTPDECYYLAAFHHAAEDAGLQLPDAVLIERSLQVNVLGLAHVLEAIATVSPATRLFYAASSHVFGSAAGGLQTEATPMNPENIYGISKACGIHHCRYFRRERRVFAAAGILYNHESHLRPAKFVSQKIVRGVLAHRRDPRIKLELGDLEATVDWGYAPDYVEAMTRIVRHPMADDFIVATGIPHTVRDFAQIACELAGVDWRACVQVRPGVLKKRPLSLLGNSEKLRRATGWAPTVTFRQMVQLLLEHAAREEEAVAKAGG